MNEENNISKRLTEFIFSNTSDKMKFIWIEPVAIMIELEPKSDCKLVTTENSFAFDYISDEQFNVWLNNEWDLKIYKNNNNNPLHWVLDFDFSNDKGY
ncbi:MAG: hypothetical protein ACKVQB_13335 [Bacteroidia bacterium]